MTLPSFTDLAVQLQYVSESFRHAVTKRLRAFTLWVLYFYIAVTNTVVVWDTDVTSCAVIARRPVGELRRTTGVSPTSSSDT